MYEHPFQKKTTVLFMYDPDETFFYIADYTSDRAPYDVKRENGYFST